jgi:hypothetical protein
MTRFEQALREANERFLHNQMNDQTKYIMQNKRKSDSGRIERERQPLTSNQSSFRGEKESSRNNKEAMEKIRGKRKLRERIEKGMREKPR